MSSTWFSFANERIGWLGKRKTKRARKGKLGEGGGRIIIKKKSTQCMCGAKKMNECIK